MSVSIEPVGNGPEIASVTKCEESPGTYRGVDGMAFVGEGIREAKRMALEHARCERDSWADTMGSIRALRAKDVT